MLSCVGIELAWAATIDALHSNAVMRSSRGVLNAPVCVARRAFFSPWVFPHGRHKPDELESEFVVATKTVLSHPETGPLRVMLNSSGLPDSLRLRW
jgi:hypothetical protein